MSEAWWAEMVGGDIGSFADVLVGILDDFEEHWKEARGNEMGETEIDEIMKKIFRGIAPLTEEWAKYVLNASTALAIPSQLEKRIASWGPPGNPVREVFERFATDSIAIKFMGEGICKAQPAAQRCIELLPLIIEAEPNDAVRKFLKRVARCYIWGFAPECVILCCSALEGAFRERLSKIGKDPELAGGTLEEKINRAYTLRLLDKQGKEYADCVRQRRNKTVHYQSDLIKDVLGTIRMTTAVLAQLYPT